MIGNGIDDIYVALSTTAFTILSNFGEKESQEIREMEVPICSVMMSTQLFEGKSIMQKAFMMADAKDMAETISIDHDKQSVYIGKSSLEETDALVDYTHKGGGKPPKEFFKRWKEKQTLMFEFDVLNYKKENVFCIRGLWILDGWAHLDIAQKANLKIVESAVFKSLVKGKMVDKYEDYN